MPINDYQAKSRRTWDPSLSARDGFALCGMGLGGEAGEVVDELKKIVFHGRGIDRGKLIEECGDVLWYIANLATELGATLDDMADANVAKLQARYPNGFQPRTPRPAQPPAPAPPSPVPTADVLPSPPPAHVSRAPGPTTTAPDEAEVPAKLVRALVDVPPFVDQAGNLLRLKAGDVATVSSGIAGLLVKRQKAVLVEVTA